MQHCVECQKLLLDHLYDLLDPAEQEFIETHLHQCVDCQTALTEARRQQSLLAQAARLMVPTLDYPTLATNQDSAESPTPVQDSSAPTPVVFHNLEKQRSLIRTVMMAAMILLTVGIPGWLAVNFLYARDTVRAHESKITQLRHQVNESHNKLDTLPRRAEAEHEAITQEMKNLLFRVEVSGPRNYQPGAPNYYTLRTLNDKGQTVPARVLVARVLDEKQQVLYEESDLGSPGEKRLNLPPDLPLTPDKQLCLEVVTSRDGFQNILREKLPLANPVFLTQLTTDKPVYRPGELLRFRSLTLERFSYQPAETPLELIYTLQPPDGMESILVGQADDGVITETKAKVVKFATGPDGKKLRGLGGGEYCLPVDAMSGRWTLTVHEARNRFPQQQRHFLVQDIRSTKVSATVELDKNQYRPGDQIKVTARAQEPGTRKSFQGAPVKAKLQFGTDSAFTQQLTADQQGKVSTIFELPKTVPAQPKISIEFRNSDGVVKQVERNVPINPETIQIRFYPEGGRLIAGVPNRVYFTVFSQSGPQSLRGELIHDEQVVAKLNTLQGEQAGMNRGLGTFTFTPEVNQSFRVAVEHPGPLKIKNFPSVEETGVVLHVPTPVSHANQPIEAVLRNVGEDRSLLIGVYCRGRLLDHRQVTAKNNQSVKVKLNPSEGGGGVTRLTVFAVEAGNQLRPMAERLIYRRPKDKLWINFEPKRLAQDQVRLEVSATNQDQQPISAMMILRVLDQRLAALETSQRTPSPLTFYHLTSELRRPEDIENADFLLSSHPGAANALDLVLGTQGWRRFHQIEQKTPSEVLAFSDNRRFEQTLMLSAAVNQREVQAWADLKREQLREDLQRERRSLTQRASILTSRLEEEQSTSEFLKAKATVALYRESFKRMQLLWFLAGIGILLLLFAITVRSLRDRRWTVQLIGSVNVGMLLVLSISILFGGTSVQPSGATNQPGHQLALKKDEASPSEGADERSSGARPAGNRQSEHAERKKNSKGGSRGVRQAHRTATPELPGGKGSVTPTLQTQPDQPKLSTKYSRGRDATKRHEFVAEGETLSRLHQKQLRMLGKMTRQELKRDGYKAYEDEKADLELQLLRAQKLKESTESRNRSDMRRGGMWGKDDTKAVPGIGTHGPFPQRPEMGRSLPQFRERLRNPRPSSEGGVGGGGVPYPEVKRRKTPVFLREYSWDQKKKIDKPDFMDTVYWHPILIVPDGKATVNLALPSATADYEVSAFGHTLAGQLGTKKIVIKGVQSETKK